MRQDRDINRDYALRMAEVGIAVFPCGPDKKPLVKWQKASSADADAIAELWSQHPNALPGIDLEKSDLVVLDGDRHGGPDGRTALRELLNQQPDYDGNATPCAITPGDGAHAYFSQNGHELTNARGDLPEGIDVRGADRPQRLAPRHPSGHRQHGIAIQQSYHCRSQALGKEAAGCC